MTTEDNSIGRAILSRVVWVFGRTSILRWASPFRMFRQLCGLQPRLVSVAKARSILVIRPDELGDVMLASAFLRELRRAAPQAKITLLVKAGCRDLVEHCPYVDSLHALPMAPHWDKPGYRLRLCRDAMKLRWGKWRGRGFDLVLLPRRDIDWYCSILTGHWLAGSGAVVVHRETTLKNPVAAAPPISVGVTALSNPRVEHEVLHQLYFLSACGAESIGDARLEIWLADADREFARNWLAEALPPGAPLIVLHPSGGRSVLKQWPKQNFRALLDRLLAETPANILIMGGGDETWIAEAFSEVQSNRVVRAVGKFGLRQLGAILEKAALFVGGDSGPMHVAAATGIPVLGIFGPTSEMRFRPWGDNCQVVSLRYECSPDRLGTYKDRCETCRYSEPRCLTELPVEMVMAAVQKQLGVLQAK